MTLMSVLVTKFVGGLPAGMLHADGCALMLSAAFIIKFDNGLPSKMRHANGRTDITFGGPGY